MRTKYYLSEASKRRKLTQIPHLRHSVILSAAVSSYANKSKGRINREALLLLATALECIEMK